MNNNFLMMKMINFLITLNIIQQKARKKKKRKISFYYLKLEQP